MKQGCGKCVHLIMTKLLALMPVAALAACSMTPPPVTAPFPATVAGTSWRVVAVNGRPAPPRPDLFFMNFSARSLSSKFGCNGMGADYVQRGAIIHAGPVIGTKMACPDMSYEIQASGVLGHAMAATWNGPSSLRLSSRGGTIELRR
jgi:heat shock protein HslJ